MTLLVLVSMPTMPVVATWSTRSNCWTLTGPCPLCRARHIHGGGRGPRPTLGYRTAHCHPRRAARSYQLVPDDQEEAAAA